MMHGSGDSDQTHKIFFKKNLPAFFTLFSSFSCSTITVTQTVETVTVILVLACDRCGKDLSAFACECIERRTKIDIIFEKTVEHVAVEIKQCPACDSKVKAPFPHDMPGPLQYGNGIKAYVIQLLVAQMINLNRVVDNASYSRKNNEAAWQGGQVRCA